MNEWSNAFRSLAPAPGDAGMGMGNQPYAPGVMTPPGDPTRQDGGMPGLLRSIHQQNNMGQARQQMSAVVAGADPSAVPPPQPSMQWTPEVQAQIMQYLMSLYRQVRPGDRMTTTGGMVSRNGG